MRASEKQFDTYLEKPVTAYTLENDNDVSVTILSQGGIVHQINVPDKQGQKHNILLSFPHTADYYANAAYTNMMIGPVAGRIGQATFTLGTHEYHLTPNEGKNLLHGGTHGFHSVQWQGELAQTSDTATLTLHHTFANDDWDFPGTMHVAVHYMLTNDNQLKVEFQAKSDTDMLFNPTYHLYFNLAGSTTINDQYLQVNSDSHLEITSEKIPTGKFTPNAGTAFDLATPTKLGEALAKLQDTPEKGFDDAFVINDHSETTPLASLSDPVTDRRVDFYADANALIVFTANAFTPDMNYVNGPGQPHIGVALEVQTLPDAINHDGFGDTYLQRSETKKQEITYQLHF